MNIKDNLISSPELAEIFGVTDRYIRMLAKDEIVKKSGTRGKYLLIESVKGFIEFLRESSSADVDLKEAKLKKETEKIIQTSEGDKEERLKLQTKYDNIIDKLDLLENLMRA